MYDFFYNHLKAKYGPSCELTYTENDSLRDFKRKIKRVLLDILFTEDSYLDIRNVIQKVIQNVFSE